MAAAKRNATVKAVETKAVKPAKIEAAEPAKALEQKAEEPVTLEKAEEVSQDKTAPAPAKKRGRKPQGACQESYQSYQNYQGSEEGSRSERSSCEGRGSEGSC